MSLLVMALIFFGHFPCQPPSDCSGFSVINAQLTTHFFFNLKEKTCH